MQGLPQGLPQGLAGQVGGVTSEQARQMQQQQQQQAAQEDQRKQMLLAVLDNGARSRLSSVALVKPERARMIENQIIQMVQSGRVQGQLGEEMERASYEVTAAQKRPIKFHEVSSK